MHATPVTTLLLTRHGQSIWNAEGRWQGQADPPLSDHGREQVFHAAARIGTTDAIVSSPQQRALETAAIISSVTGVGPVLVNDDLRERSAGVWSGLTHDEIETEYPGWIADGRRPEGFEPDESVLARLVPALRAIADLDRGATMLVVSHGGLIRALEVEMGMAEGRVPNLSGRIVEVTSDDRLRLGDQIRFLEPEPGPDHDPQRI